MALPTTGRQLVLLADDLADLGLGVLRSAAGLRTASTRDFTSGAITAEALKGADAVVFDQLGVALVTSDPDRLRALQAASRSEVLATEPERYVHAYGDESYLAGYRDAVADLTARLAARPEAGAPWLSEGPQPDVPGAAPPGSEKEFTWGLQATRVPESKHSGKGVRVAVLDTGFDRRHPDYPHRTIVGHSFVEGVADFQDGHGHGTHCIGTACGPKAPYLPPRYGIAYEAEIYAGKVLDDSGGGADGQILAGINWAVENGCRVLSLSLGAAVTPNTPYSKVFETAGKRAMKKGSLLVAAAGNESERRLGYLSPVGHPANCPSFLAVAALDARLKVGYFSNRGMDEKGGQVDIAAPGVDVLSSFPMPERNRRLAGTSMATPHVAGIAAMYAEANPKATAAEIWTLLTQGARRLPLLAVDVGAGLAQAPQETR